MILQAECIYPAFDNQTSRPYFPGPVSDYDADNEKLNSLTTPGGMWVFQYPGHEGKASKPELVQKPAAAQEVPKETAKSVAPEASIDNRKKPMSPERKAQLADSLAKGRAAKKARLESAAA